MTTAAQAPAEDSLGRSIFFHLGPGALTTLAYLGLAPALMARGFPALFTLLLVTALVLVPIELGILLYEGKRATGTWSWRAVVGNRDSLPRAQYFLWPLLLVIWGFASSMLLSRVDNALIPLFGWLPDWYMVRSLADFESFSPGVMRATFALGLVFGGLVGPIVEELYFRGYLLPRLSRFGRWAPVLHAVLFSLYHFWTPWQNPSRIALMIPMAQVVAWKRNIYLAMIAHCALNLVVWTTMFGAILRQHG